MLQFLGAASRAVVNLRSWPALMRLRDMPAPILPRPINPTFMMFPSWPSLVSLRAFLVGKPYSTRLCGKNSKSVRTTSRCHFPAETCNTIRLRMCPRSRRACALAACASRETSRQLVRGAWPQSQLVPGVRNNAGRTRHRKQPGEPCGADGVRARCRWDTPHARRPARGRRIVPALGRPQVLKQRRLRSTQADDNSS